MEVLALILRKFHKFPILHKDDKYMLLLVFIVELYFFVEDWRIGGLEDWRIGGLEDWRMWNLLRGYRDISLCGFLYGLESVEIVLSAFGGVNIILL